MVKVSTLIKNQASLYLLILGYALLSGCKAGVPKLEELNGTKGSSSTSNALTVEILQSSGQSDPTSNSNLNFDFVFNRAIDPASFTISDLILDPSSTALGSSPTITNLGDDIHFRVSSSALTQGTIKPAINMGSVNAADSTILSAIYLTDNSVTFDSLGPNVAINQSITQLMDPTHSVPIYFSIVFSEPINILSFDISDIQQNGTATGLGLSLINSGDNQNFTLVVDSISTSGTVIPTIQAGAVYDSVGNNNSSSSSIDNSVTYDNLSPTISGVTSSKGPNSYTSGEVIDISITFSESVFVTGVPQLLLETGVSDASASYQSGSGTNTLIFSYTVRGGDSSLDLDYASSSALSGGTISDAAGNLAVLTLPTPGGTGSLGFNKSIIVDTLPSTVASVSSSTANGSYGQSANISIQVQFNEVVFVTGGPPTLILETGPADASATYISGSGTAVLNFSYTVASPQYSVDLQYQSITSLLSNGALIKDAAGNSASLNLPGFASGLSLGEQKDLIVIGSPALLASVPSLHDFGTTAENSISFASLTISNTGGAAATGMTGASLAAPYDFKGGTYPGMGGTCGPILSPGASCNIVLSYSPTATGPTTDTMVLSYNDGLSPQAVDVILNGNATAPAWLMLSDGPSYDFGSIAELTSAQHTFTLTNAGGLSATDIIESGLAAPFAFAGGSYPGTGGTCGPALSAGGSCSLVVTFTPSFASTYNDSIEISYFDGASPGWAVRDISGTATAAGPYSVTVTPIYSGYQNWNSYVAGNSNPAAPTSCTGSESGYYGASDGCIHAGLAKKIVTTETSCTGLTVTVSPVDAFEWECKVPSGFAVFYLSDFKKTMGLRDLINPTGPGWHNLSVSIDKVAVGPIATSSAAAWWGDVFLSLPTSSGAIASLNTSNVIYYINSNTTVFGINLQPGVNNFSIVTLGNSIATAQASTAANMNASGCTSGSVLNIIFCFSNSRNIWIEAEIFATGTPNAAHSALFFDSLKFSRIHNTRIQNSSTNVGSTYAAIHFNLSNSNKITQTKMFKQARGLHFNSSHNNFVSDLQIADTTNSGGGATAAIDLKGSNFNRLKNIFISKVKGTISLTNGLTLQNTSNHNIISNINISNVGGSSGNSGIALLTNSSHNIINQAVVTGTDNAGIEINNASTGKNIFSHITTANNAFNSVYFVGMNLNQTTFVSMLGINSHSGYGGIEAEPATGDTTGAGNLFVDTVSVGNLNPVSIGNALSFDLDFDGFLMTQSSPSCVVNGMSNLSGSCAASAVPITYNLSQFSSSFVGKLTSSDTQNGNYQMTFSSLTSISHWLNFENFFRNWNKEVANAFPDPALIGSCSTGTCRINDWRLLTGGKFDNNSVLGHTPNQTFTTGGACLSGINGDPADSLTRSYDTSITFLKHAIEIQGDGLGNDNTLCESNEECIYAPNIGAYQGEGNFYSGGYCTTGGSAVTNAKIYKYPITSLP